MRHNISDTIMDVADAIFTTEIDESDTTIRCMINDNLDYWEREGFDVNHNYHQGLAIKRVRARLLMLEKSSQGVD